MGLIRELFSEIVELPEQFDISTTELKNKILVLRYKLPYAVVNIIFQFIDCIIIPSYTLKALDSILIKFSFFTIIMCTIGGLASVFSIGQSIYYFIKPVDEYVDFKSRFFGETAIGALFSAVFGIKFRHYR